MTQRFDPDSIDPFILAHAARQWTLASLILAGGGLAAVIWTALSSNWKVALIPLVLFLSASAVAFWKRVQLIKGRGTPVSFAVQNQRTRPCEWVRQMIWLIAFISFLLWGLSGGWKFSWLVLVAAGLAEWMLDRFYPGTGCT